jgi:hypothetical protein
MNITKEQIKEYIKAASTSYYSDRLWFDKITEYLLEMPLENERIINYGAGGHGPSKNEDILCSGGGGGGAATSEELDKAVYNARMAWNLR